jgi:phytoene/squalene synthetase
MDTQLHSSHAIASHARVNRSQDSGSLAAAITKAASQQTYYTIRFFVDRGLVQDAFRAYAYFRWVDDVLDAPAGARSEKIAFVDRQDGLLRACYGGQPPRNLCPEERMLAELAQNDSGEHPGLGSYLRNMMAVMRFDVERRDRVITQAELAGYSLRLATAVTDALHYFIGHDDPPPCHRSRYLAVTAAHITHMLRDAIEDNRVGYFNIPAEYLRSHRISPQEVDSPAYRRWVRGRVRLARQYFRAGRECLAQVKNWRCRLAGYAYAARFEWMLGVIERENYCLRADYPERQGPRAGLWMGWSTLASLVGAPWGLTGARRLATQPVRTGKR